MQQTPVLQVNLLSGNLSFYNELNLEITWSNDSKIYVLPIQPLTYIGFIFSQSNSNHNIFVVAILKFQIPN